LTDKLHNQFLLQGNMGTSKRSVSLCHVPMLIYQDAYGKRRCFLPTGL